MFKLIKTGTGIDSTKEYAKVLSTESAKWDQLLNYVSETPYGQSKQRQKSVMSCTGGSLCGKEKQRNFCESWHRSLGTVLDQSTNWFLTKPKNYSNSGLNHGFLLTWRQNDKILELKLHSGIIFYNFLSIIWIPLRYPYHMITQPL